MATRVSWPLEEMIISLFMGEAPEMGRRRCGQKPGKPARDEREQPERHHDHVSS
jgi:hypothetical protein